MKSSEIKALDNLWACVVKGLAGFKCEYCSARGIQIGGNAWLNAAHIIGRRYRGLRWSLDNGMCLCYVHHQAYDHHLPQHEDIRNEVIGPARIERLSREKNIIAKNQDFKEIKKQLQEIAKEKGIEL